MREVQITFRATSFLVGILIAAAAHADTIVILKNGTFVEGKITLQTSRMIHLETRFGTRTFRRADIEEIIEGADALDPDAVNKFAEIPAPVRAVLNAQAEHDLGHYEKALARLEPWGDYDDNKAVRARMDWLIILINERLGKWEAAGRLLKAKKKEGSPQEKIRAQAHLSIFEANPNYDLRYVGEKHARNFIKDEALRNRARQPNALQDNRIMRIALEEVCEQVLAQDEMSVKAFADKLDIEVTYEACKKLPRVGRIGRYLPYMEDLKRAEASLAKAQAILGDYGSAFELDLARIELTHLLPVVMRLSDEATQVSPETFTPGFDQRTGQLTRDGRRQWRERCDEFLEKVRPISRLLEYMVDRVNHYPKALRDLRELLLNADERLKQTVLAVKKARNRTRV